MATRQYIGARYVPKIADPVEWQENIGYEPLTIVTRLNGSFTSRKTVPVGMAPESHPEFWAFTGNYNAQVEQYRQETEQVKSDIETLKDSIFIDLSQVSNVEDTIERDTDTTFVVPYGKTVTMTRSVKLTGNKKFTGGGTLVLNITNWFNNINNEGVFNVDTASLVFDSVNVKYNSTQGGSIFRLVNSSFCTFTNCQVSLSGTPGNALIDLHDNNKNINIFNNEFKIDAQGEYGGGIWVQNNNTTGGRTENVFICNNNAEFNCGDEFIAVYDLHNGTIKNVCVENNKFVSGARSRTTNVITVGSTSDNAVYNVKINNNSIEMITGSKLPNDTIKIGSDGWLGKLHGVTISNNTIFGDLSKNYVIKNNVANNVLVCTGNTINNTANNNTAGAGITLLNSPCAVSENAVLGFAYPFYQTNGVKLGLNYADGDAGKKLPAMFASTTTTDTSVLMDIGNGFSLYAFQMHVSAVSGGYETINLPVYSKTVVSAVATEIFSGDTPAGLQLAFQVSNNSNLLYVYNHGTKGGNISVFVVLERG